MTQTLRVVARRYLLLAVALIAAAAHAQVPGDCALGHAEADLDVGDVFARVFNTGSLFFGNTSQAAYVVPRASSGSPVFAAGIWVGGLIDGELRVAGATYADFEFWPGPLDPATGRPPNPNDCSDYDRIWKVSRLDIERYYSTGQATDDLAEWPHGLGAPVFDGDGDPDNYDIAAGDQPAIAGDQMLWWVMNDVGNVHENTLLPPIGLEVHVAAFAFGSGPPALQQATFYRFRLINRNESPLEDAFLGFWEDQDLGDAADDWLGSDTLRGLSFVYNADNQDGTGGGTTYGLAPPAHGVQVLRGPTALPNGIDDNRDGQIDEPGEDTGMSTFMHFLNGAPSPTNDPTDGVEMNHFMRGRWSDGTPLTVGGSGLNPGSSQVTSYALPGDPVSGRFWSARCPSSPTCGPPLTPGNWKSVVGLGPFELGPGESDEVLLGLVFGQGVDNFDSVRALRVASTVARNAHDAGYLDPRPVPGFDGPPAPPDAVEIRRPAPNPFTDSTVLRLSLPVEADVRIALVDVLGREVAVLTDGPHAAGAHEMSVEGAQLTPGVYVTRVWVNGQAVAALPLTRL